MVNNCLVTKLKGSVNNPWLEKLNTIRVQVNGVASANTFIQFVSDAEGTIPVTAYGNYIGTSTSGTINNSSMNTKTNVYNNPAKLTASFNGGSSDDGYFDIDVSNIATLKSSNTYFMLQSMKTNKTFSELATYSPAFVIGCLTVGCRVADGQKLSNWINIVNSNNLQSKVYTAVTSYTNISNDLQSSSIPSLFALYKNLMTINFDMDFDFNALAVNQVNAGRTAGTLTVGGHTQKAVITFNSSVPGGYTITITDL